MTSTTTMATERERIERQYSTEHARVILAAMERYRRHAETALHKAAALQSAEDLTLYETDR